MVARFCETLESSSFLPLSYIALRYFCIGDQITLPLGVTEA